MKRLDRVIGRVRRSPPIFADGAMGAGIVAIGIVELLLASDLSASQRAGSLAILAAGAIGVILKRTNLWVACALVLLAALGGLMWPAGVNSTWLPEVILLYTVSERSGPVVSLVALVATFGMRFPANGYHLSDLPALIQIDFFYTALAWFAGRAQARRRAIAADLESTAALLEEEQERLARSAVALERARIARDLHALVVRGVELMSALTRTARHLLASDRAPASDAIGAIEETGRGALVEMRRLLVILRTREGAAPARADDVARGGLSARSPSVGGGPSRVPSPMARGWGPAPDLRERARRWMAIPRVADGLVVLAVAILAVAEPFSGGADFMRRPVDVVLAALVVGALLFRRRHPLGVPALIATVIFVSTAFLTSETTTADHAMIVAVYTVAALCGPWWGVAAAGAEVVVYMPLLQYFAHTSSLSWGITVLVGWDAFFVFAVIAGVAMREGRRLNAELHVQTDLLMRTRRERVGRAVDEERSRIARDVHDMVAHGVTLMVVQAGAARLLAESDPARADRALQSVERAGQQALHELRSLVGSLGGPSRDGPPIPLKEGFTIRKEGFTIRSLVDEAAEAGMPVELIIDGEPAELDAGVEVSLYRIVQEALTNVGKHAPGARAWVELRYTPERVDIQVTNVRGGDTRSPRAVPGAAQGLVGIAERAALFGGRAEAGPTPEGGFRVVASLFRERVLV